MDDISQALLSNTAAQRGQAKRELQTLQPPRLLPPSLRHLSVECQTICFSLLTVACRLIMKVWLDVWFWCVCVSVSLCWTCGSGVLVLVSLYWTCGSGVCVLTSLCCTCGSGVYVLDSLCWMCGSGVCVLVNLCWMCASGVPRLSQCICCRRNETFTFFLFSYRSMTVKFSFHHCLSTNCLLVLRASY